MNGLEAVTGIPLILTAIVTPGMQLMISTMVSAGESSRVESVYAESSGPGRV